MAFAEGIVDEEMSEGVGPEPTRQGAARTLRDWPLDREPDGTIPNTTGACNRGNSSAVHCDDNKSV